MKSFIDEFRKPTVHWGSYLDYETRVFTRIIEFSDGTAEIQTIIDGEIKDIKIGDTFEVLSANIHWLDGCGRYRKLQGC